MKDMIKQVGLTVMALGLVLSVAGRATADLIVQNTGGTGGPVPFFAGESLTTSDGGPWNNIMFNYFSDVPAVTPSAAGTLFLLTEEYVGTPAGLSPSIPGFLAQSQSISGGVYIFDASVTLQPDTQYFVYPDAAVLNSGGNEIPGGHLYFSSGPTIPFDPQPGIAANFRLSGTPVPEPASLALFCLGAGGLIIVCWRRQQD